jgi:hypothetical protein
MLGLGSVDLGSSALVSAGRGFDAALLGELLEEAKARYTDPPSSDSWLAPRLHSVLRLTRAEASDNGLWFWLSVTQGAAYVRWRWPATTDGKSLKRYKGGDRDNALSRLWWTAEIFRNGADYAPATKALSLQDVPSTWLVLRAVHNRPAALAAVDKIESWTGLSDLTRRVNRLSKVLNHHLTTVMIDAVAPDAGSDPGAMAEWLTGRPERTEVLADALPEGPPEDSVDASAVSAARGLLDAVAAKEGLDDAAPARRPSVQV